MFEQCRIRTATPDDAESLAALAERTFRDTFADDNSPDDIEAYVSDAFSLARVRAELADDANTFLLAFMDGEEEPDGYTKLRTGTTDPSVTGSGPVELQRLYVDRSAERACRASPFRSRSDDRFLQTRRTAAGRTVTVENQADRVQTPGSQDGHVQP